MFFPNETTRWQDKCNQITICFDIVYWFNKKGQLIWDKIIITVSSHWQEILVVMQHKESKIKWNIQRHTLKQSRSNKTQNYFKAIVTVTKKYFLATKKCCVHKHFKVFRVWNLDDVKMRNLTNLGQVLLQSQPRTTYQRVRERERVGCVIDCFNVLYKLICIWWIEYQLFVSSPACITLIYLIMYSKVNKKNREVKNNRSNKNISFHFKYLTFYLSYCVDPHHCCSCCYCICW